MEALSHIVKNQETCGLLRNVISIEQASSNMWFFISNQVTRSKILKNEVDIEKKISSPLMQIVMNVIWPSEYTAISRRMNVYLV